MAVAAHVRPAGIADIPAVMALWARARSAGASAPDTTEALQRLVATTPGALLVAQAPPSGEIVGALVAAWDGWRANLYRLAVDPGHRRRGIAVELVREGERRLRAKGAPRVTALVGREEEPALALWTAAGYARDEAIARFVRDL